MRPATRIGRTVIYEGGRTGYLRFFAYLWMVLGIQKTASPYGGDFKRYL